MRIQLHNTIIASMLVTCVEWHCAGHTRSQWESAMQEVVRERKKHRLQRAFSKGTWVICKPCGTIVAFRRYCTVLQQRVRSIMQRLY